MWLQYYKRYHKEEQKQLGALITKLPHRIQSVCEDCEGKEDKNLFQILSISHEWVFFVPNAPERERSRFFFLAFVYTDVRMCLRPISDRLFFKRVDELCAVRSLVLRERERALFIILTFKFCVLFNVFVRITCLTTRRAKHEKKQEGKKQKKKLFGLG
jgi:hypothetical protein